MDLIVDRGTAQGSPPDTVAWKNGRMPFSLGENGPNVIGPLYTFRRTA
jgi:hypothetical protein